MFKLVPEKLIPIMKKYKYCIMSTLTSYVALQTAAATVENSMEFPQNTKKWNCLLTQQFHCWDYTLRILKH